MANLSINLTNTKSMKITEALMIDSFVKCEPFEDFFTISGGFTKKGLEVLLKANKFPFNKKARLTIEDDKQQTIFSKKIDIIEYMDWFNVEENSPLYALCWLNYNNTDYTIIKETIRRVFPEQVLCLKN